MSKQKTSAYRVSSGNIARAVTASSHLEAAISAVIHHFQDPEQEPLRPGRIFGVLREGDGIGDERYFLTDRIMDQAGFGFKEEEA